MPPPRKAGLNCPLPKKRPPPPVFSSPPAPAPPGGREPETTAGVAPSAPPPVRIFLFRCPAPAGPLFPPGPPPAGPAGKSQGWRFLASPTVNSFGLGPWGPLFFPNEIPAAPRTAAPPPPAKARPAGRALRFPGQQPARPRKGKCPLHRGAPVFPGSPRPRGFVRPSQAIPLNQSSPGGVGLFAGAPPPPFPVAPPR